jgi:hypothetical protein
LDLIVTPFFEINFWLGALGTLGACFVIGEQLEFLGRRPVCALVQIRISGNQDLFTFCQARLRLDGQSAEVPHLSRTGLKRLMASLI